MKNARGIILFFLLIALVAGSAFAAQGGNPKKGKYLFKKNCKVCHDKGGAGGEITPVSKTMSQWDRFFKKNIDECIKHVDGKIDEQDVKDIHQFLFDHAADSPQPQTCG